MKDKNVLLEKIAREILRCQICKSTGNGKAVPGEGSSRAKIIFVGEAPGKEEAKVGRPFVGRSGKLLRSLIQKIGLREKGIYITSPVKYLPKRGTPAKKDVDHGRSHLLKQLQVINPKIIVLLGRVAALALLEREAKVRKEHGKFLKKGGRTYFLTFHPAAALRSSTVKRLFAKDFQKLAALRRQISRR